MSKADRKRGIEKPATELIEEAFYILKTTSVGTYLIYLAGALPFFLALVFYWIEMLRSNFAQQNIAWLSLVIGLLFLVMKTSQSFFCERIKKRLSGHKQTSIGSSKFLNTFRKGLFVQSLGLLLIPFSLIIAAPFGWVYAFYQNFTLYVAESSSGLKTTISHSIERSKDWPKQNHVMLSLTSLLGMVLYLGILTMITLVPIFLKRLTGIQTVFTRVSGGTFLSMILNPTFHFIVICLTYLVMDPVMKVVYVLRVFYGEARNTGEDLKADLRKIASRTGVQRMVLLVVVIVAGMMFSTPGRLEAHSVSSTIRQQSSGSGDQISPDELNESIEREMRSFEYDWRMPRGEQPEPDNWLASFLNDVSKFFVDLFMDMEEYIKDWIEILLGDPDMKEPGATEGESRISDLLTSPYFFVLLLLIGGMGMLIYYLLNRGTNEEVDPGAESEGIPEENPDLEKDEIDPSALPVNQWEEMAREMIEKGEYRLAIRALYLSCLSYLGTERLVDVKKYKSNHAYERELERSLRDANGRMKAFRETLQMFERIWYGLRDANAAQVESVQENQQIITRGFHEG